MKSVENDAFALSNFIERRIKAVRNSDLSNHGEAIDFILEPKPAKPKVKSIVDEVLTDMYHIAAISGNLDPMALIKYNGSNASSEVVLTKILMDFDMVKSVDKIFWCLEPEKRREVLTKMLKETWFLDILNGDLPDTDRSGDILRQILRGQNIDELELEPNLDLIKVLEWLDEVKVAKPELQQIRVKYKQVAFFPDHEILLKKGFIGRKVELQSLQHFSDNNGASNQLDPLLISGVGGAGKSTLLAKFCTLLLEDKTNVLVILDFDRSGIDAGDLMNMTFEIARQIGDQVPHLYDDMKQLRTTSSYPGFEYNHNPRHKQTGLLKSIAQLMGASSLRLMLILDTAEVIVQRNLIEVVITWLNDVRQSFIKYTARIFISGRELEEFEQILENRGENTTHIKVSEFDTRITRVFLKSQGLDKVMANQLIKADFFPKRPLELKLLAKLIKDEQGFSVANFSKEFDVNKRKELFLGIIYHRVLLRIEDPLVRQLACPGLILRFLNPDIIRKVLCPILNLGEITEQDAVELHEKLAIYTWLSKQDKVGNVWHRTDLRESMLKLMISAEPELAKQIHTNAIAYFSNIKSEKGKLEAFYHELMRCQTERELEFITESDCKIYWSALQASLDDLPPASRVLFRYLAKKEIRQDELGLLPEIYSVNAKRKIGQQLANKGYYQRAFEIITAKKILDTSLTGLKKAKTANLLDINILFNIGLWDELAEIKPDTLEDGTILEFIQLKYVYYLCNQNAENRFSANIWSWSIKKLLSGGEQRFFNDQNGLSMLNTCLVADNDTKTFFAEYLNHLPDLLDVLEHKVEAEFLTGQSVYLFRLLCSEIRSETLDFRFQIPLNISWLRNYPYKFKNRHQALAREVEKLVVVNVRQGMEYIAEFIGPYGQEIFDVLLLRNHSPKLLIDLLSGSIPELRNPCKYALIEVFGKSDEGIVQIMTLLSELVPFTIEELQIPEFFLKSWKKKGEIFLDDYIDLIDRCWKLPELMSNAGEITKHPQIEKIGKHVFRQKRDLIARLEQLLNPIVN